MLARRTYSTDLSDEEWQILEPLVPRAKPGGRPRVHRTRELLDAIFYVVRGGCAWRLLPHDFPTAGKRPTITSGCGVWMGPGKRCTPP
jgi:putative transposase